MIIFIWIVGVLYTGGVVIGLVDDLDHIPPQAWAACVVAIFIWPFLLGIRYCRD